MDISVLHCAEEMNMGMGVIMCYYGEYWKRGVIM